MTLEPPHSVMCSLHRNRAAEMGNMFHFVMCILPRFLKTLKPQSEAMPSGLSYLQAKALGVCPLTTGWRQAG